MSTYFRCQRCQRWRLTDEFPPLQPFPAAATAPPKHCLTCTAYLERRRGAHRIRARSLPAFAVLAQPTAHQLAVAYHSGWYGGFSNQLRCPYAPEDPRHTLWQQGWTEAQYARGLPLGGGAAHDK